jgi:hypothetical protein
MNVDFSIGAGAMRECKSPQPEVGKIQQVAQPCESRATYC